MNKFKYSINISKRMFKRLYKKHYIRRLHLLMKLRAYYGNINLKKFKKFLNFTLKPNIDFMSNLLLLFECRLDLILYRINFFKTPLEAKQYIKAGIILVNNRVVTNYKQQIYLNDIISIKNKEKYYKNFLKRLKLKHILYNFPRYIEVNYKIMKCILIFYPKLSDLPLGFKKDLKILRKII